MAIRDDYAGVETLLKSEYMGNILKEPQQGETRLFNGFSDKVSIEGKQMFIDGIGSVDYRVDNAQNASSQGVSASYFRRELTTDRMIIEIDYDEHWFNRTATKSPQAIITPEMAKASFRFLDRIGMVAATASVKYGEKGASTLTFANDGGITLDATGGITTDILRKINHRFTGTEVISPMGMNATKFVITEDEQYDMGGLTQLTSWQFQSVYPQLTTHMPNQSGFGGQLGMMNITYGSQVETGDMLSVTSGVRDCLALANDALIFGIGPDSVTFEVVPLKETKISTVRLRMTVTAGGVRTNGKNVVKVQTTVKDSATFYSA